MKNFFSLLLLTFGLSLAVQAQGFYLTGSVSDTNGNFIPNLSGLIEYEDCGTTVTDTLLTDPNGYFDYTLISNCSQVSFFVTFICPNGNVVTGQDAFYPGNQTVVMELVMDCGNSGGGGNTDSCYVSMEYVPGDFAPWWSFYADAGVLPANTAYSWDIPQGAALVDPNSASSSNVDIEFSEPGTYTVCANVVDLTTGDVLCSNCITVTYPWSGNGCTATFTSVDSFGYVVLDGYVTAGTGPYTFQWFVDGTAVSTSQSLDMANMLPGTYYVCFMAVDANGLTCEYCDTITIGDNLNCWTGFSEVQSPAGGTGLQAWAQGSSNQYSYEWIMPDGAIASGDFLSLDNYPDGTYTICVTATGADGDVCEYCGTVTIGTPADCAVTFEHLQDSLGTYNQLQSYITGDPGVNYTYEWWVNGNLAGSDDELDLSNYAPGVYYYACVVAYGDDGSVCEYCEDIIIDDGQGGGDECLDWTVIDLANAPCTMDYNPVCGCDGIEYTNACIAYYCFGVLEWTDGPCNYNGGGVGSGGNTGGEPVDPGCETTAEFFYYGDENPNGGFDVFFFGFGVNADEFVWTMGDGSTATGDFVNYTFNPTDSIQAYTVCLTTISWQDSCTATICETIVLDDTPNGFIGGEVVDGDGIGGGGQVERVTNAEGDPMVDVTVDLQDPTGNVIATTTTDAEGKYSFSGLQFGDYFVHVNIDGVNHTPDLVQLRPTLQIVGDNSYEVVGSDVLSGIDGVSFASGISVAPNPTIGDLVVSLQLHEKVDINVVVTDILGKTVRQETNTYNQGANNIELNLEGLSSGMYMISLQSNGEVYSTKVMKK